jgi:hypothetical protein
MKLIVFSIFCLILAFVTYHQSSRYRDSIRNPAGEGSPPIVEPERDAFYTVDTLHAFVQRIGAERLSIYITKVLRQWDLLFAVSLAAFACSAALLAAQWSAYYAPVVGPFLFRAMAIAALIYGFADVCEDLLLARVLDHLESRGPSEVQELSIWHVRLLTQTKMLALTVSVFGLGAWLLFRLITGR